MALNDITIMALKNRLILDVYLMATLAVVGNGAGVLALLTSAKLGDVISIFLVMVTLLIVGVIKFRQNLNELLRAVEA